MEWEVEFHPAFEAEALTFERNVRVALIAAARLLADYRLQLGRPHADTLKGSKHANMKELRFEGGDGEWPVAFAFDPKRKAIVLSGRQIWRQPEALLQDVDRKGGSTVFRASGKPEIRKEGQMRWAGA